MSLQLFSRSISKLAVAASRQRQFSTLPLRPFPNESFIETLRKLEKDYFNPFRWNPEQDLALFSDSRLDNKAFNSILKVDLVESENGFRIDADLPGVKESDLEISIENNNLIIRGHRERSSDIENATSHRVERSYGSVQRAIHLPPNADQSSVSADFENGVLKITMGKRALPSTGTKIPINVKK